MVTPRRHVIAIGIAMALTLGLSLSLLGAGTARAQANPTTITIHLAQCPAGYDGNDPFTDCHPNGISGVTFQWLVLAPGAPQSVTTDANGVASFETTGAAAGIKITEQPPFALDSFSVICSMNDGADAVPVNYVGGEIAIGLGEVTLTGGEQVICDWYNTPVGPSDGGSTGGETTTTLPATGVGPDHDGIPAEFALLASAALAVGGAGLALRRRAVR